MSVKHSEIVKLMASKLGYKHDIRMLRLVSLLRQHFSSINVALIVSLQNFSKACEYERLLKLTLMGKTTASDSAIAVICLDLAASLFGLAFDMNLALKLSAVKRIAYTNTKHTIEKLLNLEEVVTVNSLCVLLNCTKAAPVAKKILKHFKESDVKNSDLSHPQFVCMAVSQSCRLEKIKISKSKFISNSHLKASQWNELESEWTKMVQAIEKEIISDRQNNKSKKSQNIAEIIDSRVNEVSEVNHNNETNMHQDTLEVYEAWKERVLKQAYEEMETMKSKNSDPIQSIKIINAIDNLCGPPKIDRSRGVKLVFE